ncbi:16377_t:CDS:1, partial [Dentiscutata heterogama]
FIAVYRNVTSSSSKNSDDYGELLARGSLCVRFIFLEAPKNKTNMQDHKRPTRKSPL